MTVVYTILIVSGIIAFIGLFLLSEKDDTGNVLIIVGGIPLVFTTIMAITVAMFDETPNGYFIKRETIDVYNERCNNDWREGDLNKVVCADGTVVELKKLSPEKDTTNVK